MICLSRPYSSKFLKGCLTQNLLSSFLKTLSQIQVLKNVAHFIIYVEVYSESCQTSKMEHFYFRKTLHLRSLTGFWKHLCLTPHKSEIFRQMACQGSKRRIQGSILDVAAALDPPLAMMRNLIRDVYCFYFDAGFRKGYLAICEKEHGLMCHKSFLQKPYIYEDSRTSLSDAKVYVCKNYKEKRNSSNVVYQENRREQAKSTLLIAQASLFNCVSEYDHKEQKKFID